MIRVAIVDDSRPIRQSLKEKLGCQQGLRVVMTATDGIDFLEQMKSATDDERPDVVLMDIDMPRMNGVEAISHAGAVYPKTRFLVLTVFDDDEKIFDAIRAGAGGYLLKDDHLVNLLESLRLLTEYGGAPMSPLVAAKALKMLAGAGQEPGRAASETSGVPADSAIAPTPREKEILAFLAQGYDSTAIADKLCLSVHTVRKHISNLYDKLHVCSRVQAVQVAIRHKWV